MYEYIYLLVDTVAPIFFLLIMIHATFLQLFKNALKWSIGKLDI